MSLISPIAFQFPETVVKNTVKLWISTEEDVATTKTRAIFALGKEPDLIPDDWSPSGFVLWEWFSDAVLRGLISDWGGFAGDAWIATFAGVKLKQDFLYSDRVEKKLKEYLGEKITILQGVVILNLEKKNRELFLWLQELLSAFFENYKYSTQQDCDKIFDEFMRVLSSVFPWWIEDILEQVRKKLAEIHPTTFNRANDYSDIFGSTQEQVRRLVSLEKALKKLDSLPPAVDMGRDDSDIDSRFLAWQEEAKSIVTKILKES